MTDETPIALPLTMRPTIGRALLLIVAFIFMMGGSVIALMAPSGFFKAIGAFGLVFFGYAGWKLLRQGPRVAGFKLTTEGLQMLGWRVVIPWSQISGVGTLVVHNNRAVGFNVADHDRLAAAMHPHDVRELTLLQGAMPVIGAVGATAGANTSALAAHKGRGVQSALAANRRQYGWDLFVMQLYLDRPVDEAAALIAAVRVQRAGE